jgi:hypothetical protein
MKIKSHISVLEYAELIGEVHDKQTPKQRLRALERLRWRCHKAGLAEHAPGMKRHLRISTEKIRTLALETYERLRAEARFWEDGCPHPVADVELIAPKVKWCGGCGGYNVGTGWRLPLSQQREEL